VGFGVIGREVAKRAKAFGMRVLAYDPFIEDDDPLWAEYGVAPATLDGVLTEGDMRELVKLVDEEMDGGAGEGSRRLSRPGCPPRCRGRG